MISNKALFWIGYSYGEYSSACMLMRWLFNNVPDDIAICFGVRSLKDNQSRVEIGVIGRPDGDVKSWWHLDTMPNDTTQDYIAKCKELVNEWTHSDAPFRDVLL